MTDLPTQPPAADPSRTPRILIIGSAGQLGRELERIFADVGPVVAVDRNSADLADPDQLREVVRRAAPDVILNAAAYTAVDRAESEMALAHAINALAPRVLADEAAERNALLVHYSTDYVFDGSKLEPWTEKDSPAPLSVYGASKLAGEQAIQNSRARHLIFRTSWVYGPHGNNFLLTMLRLAKERDKLSIVDEQIGAPTSSVVCPGPRHPRDRHGCIGWPLRRATGLVRPLPHDLRRLSVSWFGFAQANFHPRRKVSSA
ncbi:MAG: dTDP-4-dehydrorhamnose reductase [Terracidiphilus sp.]